MSVGKFLLRLSIGIALVALLLHKHGLAIQGILGRMAELPLLILLSAILLDLGGRMLSAYRWGLLSALVGKPVCFRRIAQLYYSGMFFSLCLPTSIGGDVFRVVGLSRDTGSKSAAFASVFMDRNVGMAALLVLGTTASILLPTASIQATLFKVPYVVPLWPLFVLLCSGYVLANMVLFSEGFCLFVASLVSRLQLRFVGEKAGRLHQAVQAYRLPLNRYWLAFVLSVAYQASEIGLIWLLARGLGIELSPLVFCALVPFQAVACLLPITFNGVGIREYVICAVLIGQLGQGIQDKAMALSLVYFLGVMVFSSLVGGVVYVFSGLTRPSEAEAVGSTEY